MYPSATFRLSAQQHRRAAERIARLGFVSESARLAMVTLLDTFDGSLGRAGVRLEVRDCGIVEIVMFDQSAPNVAPPSCRAESMPGNATDIENGPIRDRIAAIIGDRALRSRTRVVATATLAAARNRVGDVTATAVTFEGIRVVGRGPIDDSTVLIEVRGVNGHFKRATRAIDALDHHGIDRVEGPSFGSLVRAVGAEIDGIRGAVGIQLDPAMKAVDGFREVLDSLAATIEANWPGVLDRSDPEFLHQLRVAVRRSRSVLAQGRQVLPASVLDYGTEHLSWLGSVTGTARNLDVHLIGWSDYTDGFDAASVAALGPIRTLIEERCERAYAALADDLRAAEQAELIGQWRVRLREPIAKSALAPHSQRRLARVMAKRVANAQAKLLRDGRAIDHDSPPEALHALRKDAKKLRYLLECFGGVMPDRRRRGFGKRLKALQNNLGEYQDTHVLIGDLVSVAVEAHDRGAPPETILAVGRLIERLDQRRSEARGEFEERFAAYDSKSTRVALDELLERTLR